MHIKLKKNRATPLYFYSGNKDNVYNLEYQKKCSKLLERKYKIVWKIVDNLDHYTKIEEEYKFIMGNIGKEWTYIVAMFNCLYSFSNIQIAWGCGMFATSKIGRNIWE